MTAQGKSWQAGRAALTIVLAMCALLTLTAGCNQPRTQEANQSATETTAAQPEKTVEAPATSASRPAVKTRTFDSKRFPVLMEHSHPWMFRAGAHLAAATWYDYAVRVFEILPLGAGRHVFDYGQLPSRLVFLDLAYYDGSYTLLLAEPDAQDAPTDRTSLWRWNVVKSRCEPMRKQMRFTGMRLAAKGEHLFVLEKTSAVIYRYEPPTRPYQDGTLTRAFSLSRLLAKEGLGTLPKKLNPRLLTFQATSDGLLFAGVSTTRGKPGKLHRWIITTDAAGNVTALRELEPVKATLTGNFTDTRFVPLAAGETRVLAVFDGAFHWLDSKLQPLAERPFTTAFKGDESYGPVPIDAATAFTWDNSLRELAVLEFDLAQILPEGQNTI
ncbi:MAG: hypothetical protein B1H03_04885 [Planctomycetales bacterium 4484_113]|nr:MAG: hypothetical protein B1H03_04885 [Planctomycetales bacterium 4484_113]